MYQFYLEYKLNLYLSADFMASLKKLCSLSGVWLFVFILSSHFWTLQIVASHHAYRNSVIKNGGHHAHYFFSYKSLKLKLRVLLAGHIVAMVTYIAKENDRNIFSHDWAYFWFHEFGTNQYTVLIMGLQNLCFEKCWKLVVLVWATFKQLLLHPLSVFNMPSIDMLSKWLKDHITVKLKFFRSGYYIVAEEMTNQQLDL